MGKRINPAVFNDYNVGRVIDKAYEIGAIKIFSAISKRAVDVFEVNNRHVSFDTTSVSVFGDYDLYTDDDESSILKITHGHSKDHRPDLKQFLLTGFLQTSPGGKFMNCGAYISMVGRI